MTSGAGRVLGGRYTLLTPIAQGGMDEVWRARDRASGHIVVAKILRPKLMGEKLSLSRLRLEACNSMSISHPSIANTQDPGEKDGIGWVVMELVDDHPLTDYLRGDSRIEPEYLSPVLVQVAMALDATVRAGVVYRNIKPANTIIHTDSMVELTDFGISRAKGQVNLAVADMAIGTAQYLPPEWTMDGAATPIGDLYALSVIAYEITAGRRLFTGETQVDIAFAHINDPVPPLSGFVPEPLADVILHLLEKDSAKRPGSGSATVREIASAARAMGVPVAPRSLPLPKATQCPREMRTPVQPSVPIVAPVRHLTRHMLSDEILQSFSGLTPKVRATTGRHVKLPVFDGATTITSSSAPIPIMGHHTATPHILDKARVPPVSRPMSAPTRVRHLHPEITGEQPPAVSGAVRSLTSTGRHVAVPAPSANPPAPVSAPIPTRPTAKTAPTHPAPVPAASVPTQAAAPKTPLPSKPQDRHAALTGQLRQRVAARQAENAAEEQRCVAIAREKERRQRELQEIRERHEARERREAEEVKRQTTPCIPQPARSESPHRDKTATASSPCMCGTIPQPRVITPSKHQRYSVYESQHKKMERGLRQHELDARSVQRIRPAAKTAYSRSVVAPPVPASRQIIYAVIIITIVIALIALAAITIRHILGSLMQPSAGAHIVEEART